MKQDLVLKTPINGSFSISLGFTMLSKESLDINSLQNTGKSIQTLVIAQPLPEEIIGKLLTSSSYLARSEKINVDAKPQRLEGFCWQ